MARTETWFDQDLKKPVSVRIMAGVQFSEDNQGSLIGVRVYDDGADATLTGGVTGYCILADGQTITVAGTREGNTAYILLPQSALLVPGPIQITIKLVDDGVITTLLACVGTVIRTKIGVPVVPASVIEEWSEQISETLQDCVDDCQAAADAMGANLATTYSTSATYPVGAYVIQSGTLYRCTTAVTTAGSWSTNSSKFTAVKLGNDVADLKSALGSVTEHTCNLYEPDKVLEMYITASPFKVKDDSTSRAVYIPCKENTKYTIFKTAGKRFKAGYIKTAPANNIDAYGVKTDNTGTRLVITTGADATYLIAYVWGAADTLPKETILNSIMIFEGEIAAGYVTEYINPLSATGSVPYKCLGWLENGTDLNTLTGPTTNGFYLMGYSDEYVCDDQPEPIGNYTRRILHIFSSGGLDITKYAIQVIENADNGLKYERVNVSGVWSSWTEVSNPKNTFIRRGSQGTTVDLNNVVAQGSYYLPYSTQRTNSPVNSASILIVYQDAQNSTTSGIIQLLISWKYTGIYKRALDGGTWSAWKLISNDDEMFMRRGTLSSSDDLDSIVTHGQYYMPYSSMPDHSPTTSASILHVYQDVYGDATSGVIQKVMSWKYDEEWKRSLNNGIWSEWKKESASYTVCDLENKYAENIRFPLNDSISTNPYTAEQKVVTLLHFSDLHGDVKSYNSLMNWANNRKSYYDDILCTGDLIDYYNEKDYDPPYHYLDFWKAQDGHEKILITIGNHDAKNETYSSHTGWERKSVAHLRELYMYGIENWGVTSLSNTTWWYKDYSNSDVRLIGLDTTIEWDTADDESQLSWFQNVLADAKTNGKSVVVAHHYLARAKAYNSQGRSTEQTPLIQCDFTADNLSGTKPGEPLYFTMSDAYQDAVESFMTSGGKFVCWLVGHTHADYVAYNYDYPNQIFFCVTSLWNDLRTSDQARTEGTPSEVAANLIGFDTQRKLIKISRIGAMSNYNLRPREMMVYNYETKTIVRQSSGMAT